MKQKLKLLTAFMCGAVFFSGVSYAATEYKAIQANYKIVVNGVEQKLSNNPVTINNSTYLPIRAVGEVLGYNVGFKDNVITLTDKSQNTISKTGGIKGALTYQYNSVIGTKPDVGANVYLIPKNLEKNSLSQSDLDAISGNRKNAESVGIYYSKADGYGNYEIKKVPSGDYIALVVSKQTTRDFFSDYNEVEGNLLKPFIKDWDKIIDADIGILGFNKSFISEVKINTDEVLTFSYDFGNTVW